MPIPVFDPRMDWRNRIPQEMLMKPDPYAEMANALTGGLQGYANIDEAEKQKKQQALMQTLGLGYVPSQPLQGGNVSLDNTAVQGVSPLAQQALPPVEAPKPTQGYIPTPQLPGISGIAPKPQVEDKSFALERLKQSGRVELQGMKGQGTKLSDDQKQLYAKMMANNELQPELYSRLIGFGGQGKSDFADIITMAQQINPNLDLAKQKQDYDYAKSVKTKQLEASFDTIGSELEQIRSLNKKIDRTPIQGLNNALLNIKEYFGDVDTAEWKASIKLFQDSLSLALGQGNITDARLKLAVESLNPNMSQDQFERVLNNIVEGFVSYRQSAVNVGKGKSDTPKSTGTKAVTLKNKYGLE